MTDGRFSKILYGIVQNPGASESEVRGMVGEPVLSETTRQVISEMVDAGLIASIRSVVGYRRIGIPVREMTYYPTALATERLLLDYVVAHPGCDEDAVNLYLAPMGGIPNWAETDIGSLESAGLIEVGQTSKPIPRGNGIRAVRTFSPTAKAIDSASEGVSE